MSIKNRVQKLEQQARDSKPDPRTVEMVLPWPGSGNIRLKVSPDLIEKIERIYGAR